MWILMNVQLWESELLLVVQILECTDVIKYEQMLSTGGTDANRKLFNNRLVWGAI